METPFKNLFQPGKIGNLTLKNRLIMSLFPAGFAQDNQVSEQMLEFYRARARGGVALIVVESPSINYPFDYKGGHHLRAEDEFLPGLKRFVRILHQEGSKLFIQLSYPAKDREGKNLVEVLDSSAIKQLGEKFVLAARQARKGGFDGVEVQAAYGGLLSRFLSPASNERQDEYGGELKNRARFLLEIMGAIRKEAKDLAIQVKLVADEYLGDGFKLEEAKKVATWLEEAGADSLLISAGTKKTKKFSIPPYSLPSGVLVPLAAEIKKEVEIPVIAMGKIKDPHLAEEILSQGKADFIGMTRALLTDPDFPLKAFEGRAEDIRGCIACNECTVKRKEGPRRQCVVNPEVGMEKEFETRPAKKRRKIWIVGGGPAGLEAAIVTSERGHQVEFYEKSDRLGGFYNLASLAPHKQEVAELNRYLIHRVRQLPVKIFLNHEIAAQEIIAAQPDVVLVAAGSRLDSPILGSQLESVIDAHELWDKIRSYDFEGKEVVVIGGGFVGCETAEILTDRGAKVTLVEMLEDVLLDINKINRGELLERLRDKGVKILVNTKAEKITKEGVVVQFSTNSKNNKLNLRASPQWRGSREVEKPHQGGAGHLPADFVILAITRKSNNRLMEELEGKVKEVYLIGDALKVGNAGSAIKSAALTALNL